MSPALLLCWLVTASTSLPPEVENLIDAAPQPGQRPDTAVTWLFHGREVVVEANGVVTRREHGLLYVLREGPASYHVDLGYFGADQSVTVTRAVLRLPEGQRYDLSGYFSQHNQGDVVQCALSFPAQRPGAAFDFEAVVKDDPQRPSAAGGFEDRFRALDGAPVEKCRYTLFAPGSLLVKDNDPADFGPRIDSAVPRQAIRKYEFETPDRPADRPPPTWSTILVTTRRDWNEVAAHYRALAAASYDQHKALSAAVARETQGKADAARALYNYVVSRIRYDLGPLERGAPSVVPHSATETFDLGRGDCKDSATLLIEMLRLAGITAWPALLSDLDGPEVNEKVPMLAQFNHLVVAVPQPDGRGYRWFDTTWSFGPCECLPPVIQGRRALVVREGDGQWRTLGRSTAADSRIVRSGDVTLAADGALSAQMKVQWTGWPEQQLRDRFSRNGTKWFVTALERARPLLDLAPNKAVLSKADDLDQPLTLAFAVTRAEAVERERETSLDLRAVAPPEPYPTDLDAPEGPIQLREAPEEEETDLRFHFAPNWQLNKEDVPRTVSKAAAFGEWSVTYSLHGDTLDYVRRVTVTRAELGREQAMALRLWWRGLVAADDAARVIVHARGAAARVAGP